MGALIVWPKIPHIPQNLFGQPAQLAQNFGIYRDIHIDYSNVLRSGTLSSAARERHSLNWERRRSATPFYQKERCGSGTPFFRAGARAALFSPSLSFLLFFFLFLTFLFSPWKGWENIFNKKTCKKKFLNGTFVKVHIFWESHKCLSYVESNLRWGFRKILFSEYMNFKNV